MISFGLLLLGIIQIFTGTSMFYSTSKDEILGVKTLKGDLSIHRYMLTSLWISVGIIYLIGAFNKNVAITASLLGTLNVIFEIIGYWFGFRFNKKFWWYPYAGTMLMGFCGVLCAIYFINNISMF
jgi:ABC-type phosphate/phosphonate transport system permease subunit